MYGSGRGVIKRLSAGHRLRDRRNPRRDESRLWRSASRTDRPIPGPLAGAIGTGMGNFGVATDGDADRIGAMDERGNFVDPHKIMALALRYLVEKRGLTGSVVRTVSTTRMIDRLARHYGLDPA